MSPEHTLGQPPIRNAQRLVGAQYACLPQAGAPSLGEICDANCVALSQYPKVTVSPTS